MRIFFYLNVFTSLHCGIFFILSWVPRSRVDMFVHLPNSIPSESTQSSWMSQLPSLISWIDCSLPSRPMPERNLSTVSTPTGGGIEMNHACIPSLWNVHEFSQNTRKYLLKILTISRDVRERLRKLHQNRCDNRRISRKNRTKLANKYLKIPKMLTNTFAIEKDQMLPKCSPNVGQGSPKNC